MPESPPKVAAVVVNYNGKDVTMQAVESLRRMTYPNFDLIVLDNASTDGSPEALASAFPGLLQVRVEVNRGSSSGYAAGFRWAFEQGYDYVLLLNNDIEVEPDLLTELVKAAESDPKIGCVGPEVLLPRRPAAALVCRGHPPLPRVHHPRTGLWRDRPGTV